MVNFSKARFEFIPSVLDSSEIDSPYTNSNVEGHEEMSKSSDRIYPRRDELFQDENGNLYLYKVINGIHKYVKISADATVGSDNGDRINKDIFMPFQKIAKVDTTSSINSAVFDDGIIAVANGNALKFFKSNLNGDGLDEIEGEISIANYADFFAKKFGTFTYNNGNVNFRVLLCCKSVTEGYEVKNTVQAFRLVSDLSVIQTAYTLEPYGTAETFTENITSVGNNQVNILRNGDSTTSFRAIVNSSIIEAELTDDTITYTCPAESFISFAKSSGNTNAVMTSMPMSGNIRLYTKDTDSYIEVPPSGGNNYYGTTILNVKRTKARPNAFSMYPIVKITSTSCHLYTSDFGSTPVDNLFSMDLEEGEEFVRVIDNSHSINHANMVEGYEKFVASFIVFTTKDNISYANLYYCIPNALEDDNVTSANERYQNSTYSVVKVGRYQFNKGEEINDLETLSYIYILDNGNILENRSDSLVMYAASQFKYLSASFADSLFAANLQAFKLISNIVDTKELRATDSYTTHTDISKASIKEASVTNISAESDNSSRLLENIQFDVNRFTSFGYDHYYINMDLEAYNPLTICDIDTDEVYNITVSFGDDISIFDIRNTPDYGKFIVNVDKHGIIFGNFYCYLNNVLKTFGYRSTMSLEELIERKKKDSINTKCEFILTEEDVSPYIGSDTVRNLFDSLKIVTRTDNSIIHIYNTIDGRIILKETAAVYNADDFNKHTVDIYNTSLLNREVSINAYFEVIANAGNLNVITKSYTDGLVYNKYIFIPMVNVTDKLVIVRLLRPCITRSTGYYPESYGLASYISNNEIVYYNNRYTMLEPMLSSHDDFYDLPLVATSSKTVMYIDSNKKVWNVNFNYRMNEDNIGISFKESANVICDNNILPYTSGAYRFIDKYNKMYLYTEYRGEYKVVEITHEGDINSVILVRTGLYDPGRGNNDCLFIGNNILTNVYRNDTGTTGYIKVKNTLLNVSADSLSASDANIGNANIGSLNAVHGNFTQLDINGLAMRSIPGAVVDTGLSAAEKMNFIKEANASIISNSIISGNRTTAKYRDLTDDYSNASLLNIEITSRPGYAHGLVHYTKDNSRVYSLLGTAYYENNSEITVVLMFDTPERAADQSIYDTTGELLNNVFVIKGLKRYSQYSGVITDEATHFSRLSEDQYVHGGTPYLLTNPGWMSTGNIAYDKRNVTTGPMEFTFNKGDKEFKFKINLGCFVDAANTMNTYVYFNNITFVNEDINEEYELFKAETAPAFKIPSSQDSWTLCNASGTLALNKMAEFVPARKEYELKADPNDVRVNVLNGMKVVYFPALVHGKTNTLSAINNVLVYGMDKTDKGQYDWKVINLQEVPSNKENLLTSYYENGNPILADIDIDYTPFIIDEVDTSSEITTEDSNYRYRTIQQRKYLAIGCAEPINTEKDDMLSSGIDDKYTKDIGIYHGYGNFTNRLAYTYASFVKAPNLSSFMNFSKIYVTWIGTKTVIKTGKSSGVVVSTVTTQELPKGSRLVVPDGKLINRNDDDKKRFVSAKFLAPKTNEIEIQGIFVKNNLMYSDILTSFSKTEYDSIISTYIEPTYFIDLTTDNKTFTPVCCTDNDWKNSSPRVGSIDLDPYLSLFYSPLFERKYPENSKRSIVIALLINTRFGTDTTISSIIMDLTSGYGYLKDSINSNYAVLNKQYTVTVNGSKIGIQDVYPKQLSSEYITNYTITSSYDAYAILFPINITWKIYTAMAMVHGCVFNLQSKYLSIPVTESSKSADSNKNWLTYYEASYRTSSMFPQGSEILKGCMEKYSFSSTTDTRDRPVDSVSISDVDKFKYKPIQYPTKTGSYIIYVNGSYTDPPCMHIASSSGTMNENSNAGIPVSSIYNETQNFAELSYMNMSKATDTSVILATASAIYMWNIGELYSYTKGFVGDISEYNILGNNRIDTYIYHGNKSNMLYNYGNDIGEVKDSIVVIDKRNDVKNNPSGYIGQNLYLNGRKVVTVDNILTD